MAEAVANDPIVKVREQVINSGVATSDELDAIVAQFEKEFDEAVEFAKNSPFPELSEVTTDMYGVA